MNTHPLFVYGTLRRGGVRAMPIRFRSAVHVGDGTVRGWLYDLGAYPGFLPDPHGDAVRGELYLVDDPTLREIDDIEGYDPKDEAASLYLRRRIEVALDDGHTQQAWIYVYNAPLSEERAVRIKSGDWIAHVNTRARTPH